MSSPFETFSRSPESEIPPLITPITSQFKSKNLGINTITLDKSLGKGAFGTVYLCRDENGEELAVKCIKSKDLSAVAGIPSLIEASIMSTIHHPYLSKALKIHSTPEKLYIVQELAISDLRIYRLNHSPSERTTVEWIHMISQAIACLHKYDIIHGDIKSNNILIFSDQKIKLTDFTLSTNVNWKKNYKPCTPTHRPLEVWLDDKWDKSVDIWAFGCTIFEIIYGKSLFIYQTKDASINALIDWCKYLPAAYQKDMCWPSPGQKANYRDCFHYSFALPDSFNTSSPLNSLILSMLTMSKRPIIQEILSNSLFVGDGKGDPPMMCFPSMIISTPVTALLPKTENKIRDQISLITTDETTIDLAYNIYVRITGMINSNDRLKLITCVWIAHKLIYRENLALGTSTTKPHYDFHEILQMERSICNYLSYRLFYKPTQIMIKL